MILDSFTPSSDSEGMWDFSHRERQFHFARFSAGVRYYIHKLAGPIRYTSQLEYIPLIHLHSGFYLEPYFYFSFAKPFDLFFYRVGGTLQINPFYGFYLGGGGGVFWIHKDTSLT